MVTEWCRNKLGMKCCDWPQDMANRLRFRPRLAVSTVENLKEGFVGVLGEKIIRTVDAFFFWNSHQADNGAAVLEFLLELTFCGLHAAIRLNVRIEADDGLPAFKRDVVKIW